MSPPIQSVYVLRSWILAEKLSSLRAAIGAADFRASWFLPATMVLYREKDDGEFWDAYMHGVRFNHAVAGAASMVGEPVERRELITAWSKNGLGLPALEDADRRTDSDLANALEHGRLAVAVSRGKEPVLVLTDRVEAGTALDAVVEVVVNAQALKQNALLLRVPEPHPGPTRDFAP